MLKGRAFRGGRELVGGYAGVRGQTVVGWSWTAAFVGNGTVVDAELMKEIVAAGCVLGPFSECPLVSIQTSGLGAVPKKEE